MSVDRNIAHLGKAPMFSDIGENAQRLLAERAASTTYRKGQLIFQEGEKGDAVYIVVEGTVKISVVSPDGDEMLLTTLTPFDTFGELALLDGGPRSASAEALQETRVLSISRDAFWHVLEADRRFVEKMFMSLGALLRRLTQRAADFVFLDLHGRVAKLLVDLAADRGQPVGDEVSLDLQLTQSDLASMVGGSRQSVNQILRSFEDRGYLEISGRQIVLKRMEALRRRAGLL